MNRLFCLSLISCLTLATAALALPQPGAGEHAAVPNLAEATKASRTTDDIIARVGDQPITWGEVNTMLNSSAVVGVSIPAVGTPERDRALILLLDKFISANLIYLDAIKQGVDKDPIYRRDVERFENAMLAGLYRRHAMVGNIQVSDQEVDDYYKKNAPAGAQLTADGRLGIKVKIRRQKMNARLAGAGKHIRDGIQVVVHEKDIASGGDDKRPDATVVAEIDGKPITWGEVKDRLIAAGKGAVETDPLAMEDDARAAALQGEIDVRIMALKARAAGLDQDRVYKVRVREYRKSHLINLHRESLIATMEPSKDELEKYYVANKARFVQPAARKVQMVVVKTREKADDLKKKIQAGQMTMYQAAEKYSIAPRAKEDLGEVGWVNKGATFPALDSVIFALGPGEVGGPVHIAAGWELVGVQDAAPPKYNDFDDATTRALARREYLNDKLNAYAVNLRKTEFPVAVYQDVMVRLSQREADAVAKLAERAKQPGSITQKRVKELDKLLKP
jgi:parvulin-like peptidyl-prolyl isomerase